MTKDRKVLLVEDDEDLRFIILMNLEELKLDITVAQSGYEAIKLLQDGLETEFIISDYQMPNGSGLELLAYLAENNSNLPFVFFTNTINPSIPVRYDRLLGVLLKFEFQELETIITKTFS